MPLSNWQEAVLKQQKTCSNNEIHVLFEHGFNLKILRMGQGCLHDVTRQNLSAWNEHFAYAFVDVNVVSRNDLFDVGFCKLMHILYNEIQRTNYDYFNDFPRVSVEF